jgi:hypothetical protein
MQTEYQMRILESPSGLWREQEEEKGHKHETHLPNNQHFPSLKGNTIHTKSL